MGGFICKSDLAWDFTRAHTHPQCLIQMLLLEKNLQEVAKPKLQLCKKLC
jgi:hypothetical protein